MSLSLFHNNLALAIFKINQKMFYLCKFPFQPIIADPNGV